MNKAAARFIMNTLRPFEPERQLVILDRIKHLGRDLNCTGDEITAGITILKNEEWQFGDGTLDAVVEAIETCSTGTCDGCSKHGPLRSYSGSSGETDQCWFDCE